MDIKGKELFLTDEESKISGIHSPISIEKFNRTLEKRRQTINQILSDSEATLSSDPQDNGMQERAMAHAVLASLIARKTLLEDIAVFVLIKEVESLGL